MVKMDIHKNPKKLLEVSVKILERSYKVAKKKDDLEVMLAISDRLMILYSTLEDVGEGKKIKPLGFVGMVSEDE